MHLNGGDKRNPEFHNEKISSPDKINKKLWIQNNFEHLNKCI